MPFTLSHVIAIVPFNKYFKNYTSISGLIMGSMAPDYEFFLRITLFGIWGHSFQGIFFFDFPVSIALIFIFHFWVRDALIAFLPNSISLKYHKFYKFNWLNYFKKSYLKVFISIFLGIFTHFAWDNITHEPNYVSPFYLDVLEKKIEFLGLEFAIYTFLQIISSILGLAWFLRVLLLNVKIATLFVGFNKKCKFWFYFLLVTIFIFCGRYIIGLPDEKPFGQFIVVLIGSCIYSLILVSIFYPKPNEVDF